jgi:hypothetical protein
VSSDHHHIMEAKGAVRHLVSNAQVQPASAYAALVHHLTKQQAGLSTHMCNPRLQPHIWVVNLTFPNLSCALCSTEPQSLLLAQLILRCRGEGPERLMQQLGEVLRAPPPVPAPMPQPQNQTQGQQQQYVLYPPGSQQQYQGQPASQPSRPPQQQGPAQGPDAVLLQRLVDMVSLTRSLPSLEEVHCVTRLGVDLNTVLGSFLTPCKCLMTMMVPIRWFDVSLPSRTLITGIWAQQSRTCLGSSL